MNVLDLFSGIGAFSLGLERAGMRTVAFCEVNEYCRRILKKHWPDVPLYEDVRTLTGARLRADGIVPDVICGGFPCQDISVAGSGAGLEGERSGLWREYLRIIKEYPEAWVIIENVAALRNRGLGTILGQLAALGRDAEWHCIPAAAVGAPHIRDRVWITVYPQHSNSDSERSHRAPININLEAELRDQQECQPGSVRQDVAYADNAGCREQRQPESAEQENSAAQRSGCDVSDAQGGGCAVRWRPSWRDGHPLRIDTTGVGEIWRAEPDVGRVADGVADRVDRLTALGNAVVPQIPEIIGRAIMRAVTTTDGAA